MLYFYIQYIYIYITHTCCTLLVYTHRATFRCRRHPKTNQFSVRCTHVAWLLKGLKKFKGTSSTPFDSYFILRCLLMFAQCEGTHRRVSTLPTPFIPAPPFPQLGARGHPRGSRSVKADRSLRGSPQWWQCCDHVASSLFWEQKLAIPLACSDTA